MLLSVCSPAFVGADLNTAANNAEHRTSQISVEKLVLRRGQSFKLDIKLRQAFEPSRYPLKLIAQTGWCLTNNASLEIVTFANLMAQAQNPNCKIVAVTHLHYQTAHIFL